MGVSGAKWRERLGLFTLTLSSLQLVLALGQLIVMSLVSRNTSGNRGLTRWSDAHNDLLHVLAMTILLSSLAALPISAFALGGKRVLSLTFGVLCFAAMFSIAFGIMNR